MKTMQQGFTLIELMIVVAIIGILAAVAVPQYQTYVAKSQVSRVVAETADLKTGIEDCYNNGISTPTACDTHNTSSSLMTGANSYTGTGAASAAAGQGFATVNMAASGVASIVGTFGNSASSALTGKTITWSRDANGTWSCVSTADAKYNTAACPAAAAAAAAGG